MKKTNADRPINLERAYSILTLGAAVIDTRTGLTGTINDVRRNDVRWWELEYKVLATNGSGDFSWSRTEDIEFHNPWKEFERKLKRHDWTYEMSDDSRVWDRGRKAYHDLRYRCNQLSKLDKERAEALLEKYRKKGWGED